MTAPTRFVTANGIRYACRRIGAATGTPLVFLQRFRGGMDRWDPAATDGLAANRPVTQAVKELATDPGLFGL